MENLFHKHLDVCGRCRNRPFDLCPEGVKLLDQEANRVINKGIQELELQRVENAFDHMIDEELEQSWDDKARNRGIE
jgi:hypothetical protein